MSNGFDDLSKKLNKMAKAAQEMDGEHSVPMSELFTNDFVSANTKFSSIEEFFEVSGFDCSSEESFAAIPDDQMDAFVSDNTNFDTWSDFMSAAAKKYTAKKLGF
ncbi:hypothetical protein [Enterococcus faecium]|uniref:hypothetical protein n=1 Tax=Enterococcus faecium TaxID=1352 RepID=UPI00115DACD2|nr:hypothetical protein [Enterococcus faecium]